jgi:endonuclease/exonuclease/phosphatase family metal-dependent hydrolase
MKIATLNIDWARKLKRSKTEAYLNQFNLDILVITEGINIDIQQYPYKYLCEPIPENTVYQGINYTKYLNGEVAYRTIIYSKYPCTQQHEVNDPKTSIAIELETPFGNLVVYATIIGTQFRKKPYAKTELEKMIADCTRIYKSNKNLIIAGDLNTSFRENEKSFSINASTTQRLVSIFDDLILVIPTNVLAENIDHIIIPQPFDRKVIACKTFVEKNILSDHKGVYIELF